MSEDCSNLRWEDFSSLQSLQISGFQISGFMFVFVIFVLLFGFSPTFFQPKLPSDKAYEHMTFACQHIRGCKLIHRLIFYSRLWSRYFHRASLMPIDNGVQVVGILCVLAQPLYQLACTSLLLTCNHLLDIRPTYWFIYSVYWCVCAYLQTCMFSFQMAVPFNQCLIHTIKMSLENVVPQGNS